MFNQANAGSIFGVVNSFTSFIAAQRKAESDRQWQAYNNRMTRIQNAMNQNALTTNERMRKEREQTQFLQIEKSRLATRAAAEVSAASTGTVGNSVNMVLFDANRNATRTAAAIKRDSRMQDVNTDHQRLQSTLQTTTQLDLRVIPNPSPVSLMLGIGEAIAGWK